VTHDGKPRDVKIRYLLFTPKDYKPDGKPWPLLLFLHGLGESSDTDINRAKIHGPASMVDSRPDFPFVVVTPQCSPPGEGMQKIIKAWKADQLIQLVDHIAKNLNIDDSRVYVTGLSMGGFGTFRLVAAYPDRFAAAVPVCGGGEPEAMARALSSVPLWVFHGERDKVVPVARSQEMVDAIRKAGGDVKLTIYPAVEHNSWKPTYDNPEVFEWLLKHRRPQK